MQDVQDLGRSTPSIRAVGETIREELSAQMQAWGEFLLAEAFPTGRNVVAAARRVPLRVTEVPRAEEVLDTEEHSATALITVHDYLLYIQYLYRDACECWMGEYDEEGRWVGEFCAHLETLVRQEIQPVLTPLYRAVVAAAFWVTSKDGTAEDDEAAPVWASAPAPSQEEASDHAVEDGADEDDDGEQVYYSALLDAEYYESLARALPDVAEEDRRVLHAAGQEASGVDALRRLTAVAQALLYTYTGSVEGV